jgi:hypothetical protein
MLLTLTPPLDILANRKNCEATRLMAAMLIVSEALETGQA